MKEIKLIHFVVAVILVLLAIAIFQWSKLSRNAPVPSGSDVSTAAPADLPPPQNDIERLNAPPPVLEPLPPLDESQLGKGLEPKKAKAGKAMV